MNLWKGKLPKKWYFLGLYPKLWPKTKNTHFGKFRTPGPPTPYLGQSPIKYHLFLRSFPNHPSDLCKKMEVAWKDEGAFLKVVYHVLKTWKDCMNDLPRRFRKRAYVFPPIFNQSQVWSELCLCPLSIGVVVVVVETRIIWLWLLKKTYIMSLFRSLSSNTFYKKNYYLVGSF